MKKSILIKCFMIGLLFILLKTNTKAIEPAAQELWKSTLTVWGPYFVNSCVFSHDGKYLYQEDNGAYKVDAFTGKIIEKLAIEPSHYPLCLNILPGDSVIAYLREIQTPNTYYTGVSFYNINTKKITFLDTNKMQYRSLKFSKDYTKFATYNQDRKKFEVYSTNNLQKIGPGCFNYAISGVVGWLSDSTFLASYNDQGVEVIAVFNINTGERLHYRWNPSSYNPSISPDGNYLIGSLEIADFGIYRSSDLELVKTLDTFPKASNAIFDNTGRYVFLDYDGNGDIYDLQTDKVIFQFKRMLLFNKLNDSNNLLFSTSGIMYKLNWNQIVSVNENSMIETIYPNPTNNLLNISQNIQISQAYSLKISSINGELIQEVLNTFLPVGQFTQSIDVSSLSNRVYFLTLQGNQFMKTWQFIKE